MRSRGFTLIELLVVIAIIAILASILFPVFAKAREKARQTTCLSQVRQMATALQMFSQDNNGKYPGIGWAQSMSDQGVSTKMFFCPSDSADVNDQPVSYGYSGLLLRPDQSGVSEASVKAPTEVGAFVDAAPAKAFPNGGIVYGGGLADPATYSVSPSPRHSKGVVIGYADGHAKFAGVSGLDEKDVSNPITRAFILASPLGLIENASGGIEQIAITATSTSPVTIGGEACTAPILTAAAELWKKLANAPFYARGFFGQKSTVGRPVDYVWGCGDGNNGTNSVIAKDALVIVVAKNSKIPAAYLGSMTNSTYNVGSAVISDLFAKGYEANTVQAYTFDTNSGTRDFFTTYLTAAKAQTKQIADASVVASGDADMVDKVANDPYGIGYCSAAFADTERVTILAIGGAYFPSSNTKARWTYPSSISAATWPLFRNLYITVGGTALRGDNKFVDVMLSAAGKTGTDNGKGGSKLQAGPLFKASYFLP